MLPVNPHSTSDEMEDLNSIKTQDGLDEAFRRVRTGVEDFHILGIQTRRISLPSGLEEMLETATEILSRGPQGITVQACCRNLLDAAETPDGQTIPIYGDSQEIMVHISQPGNPYDIGSLVERQEFMVMMFHQEQN